MKYSTWSLTISIFLLTVFFMGFLSCSPDENCFTDQDTRVKINFKTIIYPDTDSAFLENDTLIIAMITALNTDSILVELDTLSIAVLPVNTGANTTVFIFDSDQGVDTLELLYKREQRLISVDCGPEEIIDNLEAGQFTFDSLRILNPGLIQETTNVEIYR